MGKIIAREIPLENLISKAHKYCRELKSCTTPSGAPLSDIFLKGFVRYVHDTWLISRYVHEIQYSLRA